MRHTVFYSWQSDSKSSTNRSLIGDALTAAVEALTGDDTLEIELAVDRDTKDEPGSPDISGTIFSKIDSCSIFVGDVSIVTPQGADRPLPNPNVLIEVGYAIKALGYARIILIQNVAYGTPELLPFDLRSKRVTTYSCMPDATEKAPTRRLLAKTLEAALRESLRHLQKSTVVPSSPSPIEILRGSLDDPTKRIAVVETTGGTIDRLETVFNAALTSSPAIPATPAEGRQLLDQWNALTREAVAVVSFLAAWCKPEQAILLTQSLEQLASIRQPGHLKKMWTNAVAYPALRLLFASGISAVISENMAALDAILLKGVVTDLRGTHPLTNEIQPLRLFDIDSRGLFAGLEKVVCPGSEYLFESLRDEFRGQIKRDDDYERAFNRFEYYLALAHGQLLGHDSEMFWAPAGRFGWRDRDLGERILNEAERSGPKWPPFTVGLFGGSLEKFRPLHVAVEASIRHQVRTWRG